MSLPQDRRRRQLKTARLDIIAELYKRGYSLRKITEEVKRRLNIPKLAVSTTYNDVQTLLKEWRESRIENIDQALQLELERIDDTTAELWEQWDKSKAEAQKTTTTRSGRVKGNVGVGFDAGLPFHTKRTSQREGRHRNRRRFRKPN